MSCAKAERQVSEGLGQSLGSTQVGERSRLEREQDRREGFGWTLGWILGAVGSESSSLCF